MIAKCKAIAHGGKMLDYAMREGKMKDIVSSNLLISDKPDEILLEMEAINSYSSRCKNKYLRFEIGIAPQDEKNLDGAKLKSIVNDFAKRMRLENHQWIACSHKDTDNLHIHLVANRMDIGAEVYKTDFVSNRSAKVAEEISRERGLIIAKEVRAEKNYTNEKTKTNRNKVKLELQKIAYSTLKTTKSPKEFVLNM